MRVLPEEAPGQLIGMRLAHELGARAQERRFRWGGLGRSTMSCSPSWATCTRYVTCDVVEILRAKREPSKGPSWCTLETNDLVSKRAEWIVDAGVSERHLGSVLR